MFKSMSVFLIGTLLLVHPGIGRVDAQMCDRTVGMITPKTAGSGKFEIVINGGLERYVPGAMHTVRIQGQGDPYTTEKFSGFLLVAEPAVGNSGQVSAGTFKLKDDSLSRFSEFCPDAVKHASEVAKPEVQVFWIAPPASAGCVIFRATVIKNPQQWYMDDDNLTKQLCPDEDEDVDNADSAEPCRACDEAKYELTFEGLWSSLSHPRHFPNYSWVANFSDIIGASHSPKFRVWEYGKNSSEGLRRVAEFGVSTELERELKEQSESIRTIIKARGLRHTNFYGLKTFAVFRADKDHNLISFVSKIGPSPDWFVGVTGLNLCLGNGSWLMEKEMNLYPIDAGTDSGVTYESHPPDLPTDPRQPIRRIVGNSDSNSPFFSPDGNTLKPFAKLRLQQQRSYKRGTCDETSLQPGGISSDYGDDYFYDDSPDRDRPECSMHQWSQWSSCLPSCGKGTRRKTRKYVNEPKAREFGCSRKDSVEEICYNAQSCKGQGGSYFDEFSSGSGVNRETVDQHNVDNRNPYNTIPATRIPYTPVDNRNPYITNVEPRIPYSPIEPRNTYTTYTEDRGPIGDPMDDACGTTEWRPWSICADPCGTGVRYQMRTYLRPSQAKRRKCEVKLKNMEQCPRTLECRDSLPTKVEEGCEVSGWGPWQPCTQTCGRGVKTRYRVYKFPNIDHRKCILPMQETVPCEGLLPYCPAERTIADCREPRSAGECRQSLVRWYFDPVKLRCLQFTYTGCKASKNNFQSRTECDSLCAALRENSNVPQKTRHSRPSGQQSSYYQSISPASRNPGYGSQSNTGSGYVGNSNVGHADVSNTGYSSGRGHTSTGLNSHSPYASGYHNTNMFPQTQTQNPTTTSTHSSYSYPNSDLSDRSQIYNYQSHFSPSYNDGPAVDCKMSPWSAWSRCSVKCGRGWKYQSRYVQTFNENGGQACPKQTERSRRCRGTECSRNNPLHPSHVRYNPGMDEYNYQE